MQNRVATSPQGGSVGLHPLDVLEHGELISCAEIARRGYMPEKMARRWIAEGRLPFVQSGKTKRVSTHVLARVLHQYDGGG